MSVYNEDGRLLDTCPIAISNFTANDTKSFNATFFETSPNQIAKFKLQFENGF